MGGNIGGITSGCNVGGVNGSGSLGGSKSTMGSTMLDKHMAVAAVAHHSQQQHAQLAGGFLHHHKISSGDPLNSQSTTSHSSHPAHSGHLVNGTILKTALTNPSEVSFYDLLILFRSISLTCFIHPLSRISNVDSLISSYRNRLAQLFANNTEQPYFVLWSFSITSL